LPLLNRGEYVVTEQFVRLFVHASRAPKVQLGRGRLSISIESRLLRSRPQAAAGKVLAGPPGEGEEFTMAIATTNPATGEVVKTFEPLTGAQIEQKLQLAVSAFRSHRRTSFAERASKMLRVAEQGKVA